MKKDNSRLWALAINSTHARIIRGFGPRGEAVLPELNLSHAIEKPRDVMSDKPGRSFASSGGGRRSAIEYATDPVAEGQKDFIRQVIALLEKHRGAKDFDRLVIFAEHDMLGLLRPMLPKALAALVVREEAKNLLHLPEHALSKAILHELDDGSSLS